MSKMIAIDHAASANISVGRQPGSQSSRVSVTLRSFAWFVLVYNIVVILWGAVVRATGSGAGCGDQWPLCDGAAIPQSPQFHTMVEFAHRLMSGGALILIVALLVWTWRVTRKGHLARWTTVIALALVINEAFLGALLVTVAAHSASVATGVLLFSCHLTNTLLLVAALALTAEF
ncbi:MAG TPA: COX15/CtaA family protein, partial [Acidobacteriaceae bacterium]|nr:COX15/CtaA family protein [Acidobacteriaceae bacterium]